MFLACDRLEEASVQKLADWNSAIGTPRSKFGTVHLNFDTFYPKFSVKTRFACGRIFPLHQNFKPWTKHNNVSCIMICFPIDNKKNGKIISRGHKWSITKHLAILSIFKDLEFFRQAHACTTNNCVTGRPYILLNMHKGQPLMGM
jgi:hypothetical protein